MSVTRRRAGSRRGSARCRSPGSPRPAMSIDRGGAGRTPLELSALRLGGRRDGPHVLITGGVHGDEFEPMAALRRLAVELSRHEGAMRGRVTLVPVVNEA